ncbi:MAG: GIY-YIG nuclease family protein [Bacteroidetes bacterium]|nr:GIY-YIG nuclease family protein [Bacteroidota bacterium]
MAYCYILFSEKLNRFYTGACQTDINERIQKHNDHSYGNHRYTAKASDWDLFLLIDCQSYPQAINIERHIKKMKSSAYIKNLKTFPDIIEKLKKMNP